MAAPVHSARRAQCPDCLRPQSTCICQWVQRVENHIDVLILQHPLEVGHAKGSGLLLRNSLRSATLAVGEVFDPAALHDLLFRALPHAPDRRVRPALLYPENENTLSSVSPLYQADTSNRLVVLDGTWRKSRKMLHLNPLLQQLPRAALTDVAPSRYRIRKAHRDDQLSTLEATCQALMQMESDQNKYQPLLHAFDGFVAQQQSYIDLHANASRMRSSSS